MIQKLFSSFSPGAKLFFAGFLVIAIFLLVFVIGGLLAIPIFDVNIFSNPEILSDFDRPGFLSLQRYFQIVQSLGFFLIPPLLISFLYERSVSKFLCFNKRPLFSASFLIILLIIIMQPAINLIAGLNESLLSSGYFGEIEIWFRESENNAIRQVEAFFKTTGTEGYLLNILTIAIIPALGEELLFRGVLQKILVEWFRNIHVGIFLAALLFSTIHFQFYGFIPRLLLGMFFGYLLVWYNSIWYPILAHFINNAFSISILHFIKSNSINSGIEDVGYTRETLIISIVSLVLTCGLIYFIFRKSKSVL